MPLPKMSLTIGFSSATFVGNTFQKKKRRIGVSVLFVKVAIVKPKKIGGKKETMKKKLLAVVLVLAMMLALVGCSIEKTENGNIVEKACDGVTLVRVGGNNDGLCIYVHAETRVMYVSKRDGYRFGITVMLDADGKPLIWEGEL